MDNIMMHPAMMRRYCEGYFEPLRVQERKNGLDMRGFFTISAQSWKKKEGVGKMNLTKPYISLESP